jgi:hypothetical protein
MTFKPFFVHAHHEAGRMTNAHPRGFTAYVKQDDHQANYVQVSASLCSPRDQFIKAEGRRIALAAPIKTINKRDLPRLLSALGQLCELDYKAEQSKWYYILKFVV